MLSTHFSQEITSLAIVVAAVQFPVYGWLAGYAAEKEKRRLALLPIGFHAAMLVLIFIFPDSSFS